MFALLWWRHAHDFVLIGGYDGQFYYRLAVSPFSTSPVVDGVRFDYPAYRQQRILYPFIVHILSGGNRRAVLWLLPAVNCAAIISIALLSPRTALPAYWPGFLFSLARDLAEPLEVALLFAALFSRRRSLIILALVGAVLTRETALIAAAAFVVAGILKRDFRAIAGLTAIVVFAVWKVIVFRMWHLPFSIGAGNVIGVPFSGIWSARGDVVQLVLLLIFTVLVLMAIRSADLLVKIAFIAYALFAVFLTGDIWIEDWAYLRALAEFGAFGALIIPPRRGAIVLGGSWVALACDMLRFR